MTPLVSVILPVRNGAEFIQEAVNSLRQQTFDNFEIIVIDDGSTDATPQLLQEITESASVDSVRLRPIRTEQLGVWAARNIGVKLAVGELLLFQDADDVSLPQRIEHQVRQLRSAAAPSIAFGHFEEFADPNSGIVVGEDRKNVPGESPNTMAVHRSVFETVGPFATRWVLAGFLDWILRARAAGIPTLMNSEIVLRRRIHLKNSGKVYAPLLAKEYAEVLLKSRRT